MGLGSQAKLRSVTQLTYQRQKLMQESLNIHKPVCESVRHYAKKTAEAGLDGVFCSAQEKYKSSSRLPIHFICLRPGIRPAGVAVGEIKRVMTHLLMPQIGAVTIS